MPSGPAVDQTFPSGKIFGVWTDTTVMLELPPVWWTPDSACIYHTLWDPLGWTVHETSKREMQNWNIGEPISHHPLEKKGRDQGHFLFAAVRTR